MDNIIGAPYGPIRTTDWTSAEASTGMSAMALMDMAEVENTARAIAADYANRPDGLIEILHRLQAALGYVPEAAVRTLADVLEARVGAGSHCAARRRRCSKASKDGAASCAPSRHCHSRPRIRSQRHP